MGFDKECKMTIQGHPRSLILAPIKSAYRTSCWSSIVTLVLSYRSVSEISPFVRRKPLLNTLPHPCSGRNFGCSP